MESVFTNNSKGTNHDQFQTSFPHSQNLESKINNILTSKDPRNVVNLCIQSHRTNFELNDTQFHKRKKPKVKKFVTECEPIYTNQNHQLQIKQQIDSIIQYFIIKESLPEKIVDELDQELIDILHNSQIRTIIRNKLPQYRPIKFHHLLGFLDKLDHNDYKMHHKSRIRTYHSTISLSQETTDNSRFFMTPQSKSKFSIINSPKMVDNNLSKSAAVIKKNHNPFFLTESGLDNYIGITNERSDASLSDTNSNDSNMNQMLKESPSSKRIRQIRTVRSIAFYSDSYEEEDSSTEVYSQRIINKRKERLETLKDSKSKDYIFTSPNESNRNLSNISQHNSTYADIQFETSNQRKRRNTSIRKQSLNVEKRKDDDLHIVNYYVKNEDLNDRCKGPENNFDSLVNITYETDHVHTSPKRKRKGNIAKSYSSNFSDNHHGIHNSFGNAKQENTPKYKVLTIRSFWGNDTNSMPNSLIIDNKEYKPIEVRENSDLRSQSNLSISRINSQPYINTSFTEKNFDKRSNSIINPNESGEEDSNIELYTKVYQPETGISIIDNHKQNHSNPIDSKSTKYNNEYKSETINRLFKKSHSNASMFSPNNSESSNSNRQSVNSNEPTSTNFSKRSRNSDNIRTTISYSQSDFKLGRNHNINHRQTQITDKSKSINNFEVVYVRA